MIAAIAAKRSGNEVTLFEKNEKLGKKLFLTGKGRCNLTNACDPEELFRNIVRNPKFMYSSIYGFDSYSVMAFFEELGLKIKTERGNRVFPLSDHSSDVIKVLSRELHRLSVDVCLGSEVTELDIRLNGNNDLRHIVGIKLRDGTSFECDKVIMACGGCSYASTGSDGSCFDMIPKDIKVTKPEPSLVPLVSKDSFIPELMGVSLKNVSVTVTCQNRRVYEGFGEMLFTHFGLSGPLILSASAYLSEKDYMNDPIVHIDLKPALDEKMLDERILRDFSEAKNKDFINSLGGLLPQKLIKAVVLQSGIEPTKKVNSITKEERRKLASVLKDFKVNICGNRGFDEAIITRGGVSVKEIDPSTMMCKKIEGLYMAGEMIDVDALTGGFNLQIAWASGYLAGQDSL